MLYSFELSASLDELWKIKRMHIKIRIKSIYLLSLFLALTTLNQNNGNKFENFET